MPEAPPGDVIERYFDHDGWAHRKPFARLTFSPPARAAGSVPGKAGRFDDRPQQRRGVGALFGIHAPDESNVVQRTVFVQAQQ